MTGRATGNNPADAHDVIRVVGARENNSRSADVVIPKRRLTVFTGVSGLGESSLVFATIATRSCRLINETHPAFVQGFMEIGTRPDIDRLEGLTPAIVMSQERMGSNPRSTLGTISDVGALLRVPYSTYGVPHIGSPQAFAFNTPSVTGGGALTAQRGSRKIVERKTFTIQGGTCPACEGMGQVSDIDLTQVLDETLSLKDGAITIPGYTAGGWQVCSFIESGLFPVDIPVGAFTPRQRDGPFYKEPTKIKVGGVNVTYEELVLRIRRSILSKEPRALQPHIHAFVERAVVFGTCPQCHGTRPSEPVRSCLINGKSVADACAMQISDLAQWITRLQGILAGAAPLPENLEDMLDIFVLIELGYLSLDRPASTLSGGKAQHTKLVRHLGSALTDVTYVFDKPNIGLHPHDLHQMNELLLSLRNKGNTVLVIEHRPETTSIADHVVDLGPGAETRGGRIRFEGMVEQLCGSDTLTGRHLTDRGRIKNDHRSPTGTIEIRGASTNNLRGIDTDIPLGVLSVIIRAAGSGKPSFIHGHLSPIDGVVTIDQVPIKGSRRSNAAIYTGLLNPARKAFATANKDKGAKPARFSANPNEACPVCDGTGIIETRLGLMETVESRCQACEGRRFKNEVLAYRFAGCSIADVLDMSVETVLVFFSQDEARLPAAARILSRLKDVGLGYLHLGQALTTLSGGECQRLKLAVHLSQEDRIIVLNEPTVGLHPADIEAMLMLLGRLVDGGRTVVVIEYHQAVIAHADWIINLGPGAGHDGDQVVFTGAPVQTVAERSILMGQYLARYVEGDNDHAPE